MNSKNETQNMPNGSIKSKAQNENARDDTCGGAQENTHENALVLCSGGLDSSTLLALSVEQFGANHVKALSISYGQKHIRELKSARNICAFYKVPLTEIDLSPIFAQSNCSLLSHSNEPVPHESYESQLADKQTAIASTYVPYRNGLFISTAASIALSLDCQVLLYGAHHDDWAGNAYPDCSPEFVHALAQAVSLGSGNTLRLEAPFVNWNKARIVKEGLRLHVPYELTWSCYEGGEKPCGTCGTCIDRARAFAENKVTDPLLAY